MEIDSIKALIKDLPISSVISNYIKLSKAGSNLKGLCPFHQDKNPSLMVSDQKGLFKCFSCDVGGDSIYFVQKLKNLEFLEAMREISQVMSLGVELSLSPRGENKKFEKGTKFFSWAISLYQKNTLAEEGKEVYSHFIKERKLSEEICKKFQLGVAPSYDFLMRNILRIPNREKKEESLKMAEELGLLKSSGGDFYDTFKSRIIIPIRNRSGRLVGLSSRGITEKIIPKYLNSKESFLFNKRDLLYGYYFAKQSIREKRELVLVEGNLDVVAMHQYGFSQTVGIMGIALNELLLREFERWVDRTYLLFDNDEAGVNATLKALPLFFKKGKVPLVPDLGSYKDPDELLKSSGDRSMREALIQAPSAIDWLMDRFIPKILPQSTSKRLEILGDFFLAVSPLGENILAFEKILQASKKLELETPRELILENYKTFLKDREGLEKKKASSSRPPLLKRGPLLEEDVASARNCSTIFTEEVEAKKEDCFRPTPLQRKFLVSAFSYPDFLSNKLVCDILDVIEIPELRDLIDFSKKIYKEGESSLFQDTLLSYVSRYRPILKESIGGILFDISPERSLANDQFRKEKLFKDLYFKIQREKLLQERKELRRQYLEEKNGEKTQSFMKEMSLIENKIRNLGL